MTVLDLSLAELAVRAGFNLQTVQRYARDAMVPGPKAYAKLVAVLGDGRDSSA